MNQFPGKNYFTLPNEIFSLGLGAGEIAVYAYLRCLENPSTYQCWPSYATIGKAIGRTKNTVRQYVDALSEKGLISTEPTSVLTKSRIKKNGNLCYTIRPIHEAVEIFHTRQLSAVELATERRQRSGSLPRLLDPWCHRGRCIAHGSPCSSHDRVQQYHG